MALQVGFGDENSNATPNYASISETTTLTAGSLGVRLEAQMDAAFGVAASNTDKAQRKRFCVLIAHMIKWGFRETADLKVGTTSNYAGVQRDNTGGNPATLAPSATKTVLAPIVD